MRTFFWLALLAAAAISISGCGYAGEPKPPALNRPEKVTDLAAAERGSKIIVTFTLRAETTEGLPIVGAPDVEVRIGAQPAVWDQAEWESHSERVPVAAEVLRGRPLARSVEIDAAKYVGKTAVIGVRVHGPGGRDAGWSRLISLPVGPVLTAPGRLQAANARNAVHLAWVADAPGFRIFRRGAGSEDWVQIGESTQPSFDDPSPEYGKVREYSVVSVRHAGEAMQESERSDAISFTPRDTFPPAVPGGLAAITGARTIELVWDRVADSDLAGYRVYRNGQKVADGVVTPTYSDPNVVAGTRYSYQVSAVDQAGNESEKCTAVEAVLE